MGLSSNVKLFFKRINKAKELNNLNAQKIQKFPNVISEKISFNSSHNPQVSIIIPFYNQSVYTINCLYYLNKNLSKNHPFEIILIDDNSSEIIDFSLVEGIKIIRNQSNLGFEKSVNIGITAANGEYIYLLKNDTEVKYNFLEELFYVFENFENVGAVGSMLINPDNTLHDAGNIITKNLNFNKISDDKKIYYPEINFIRKVDYCANASLLFKKINDNGECNYFDAQFTGNCTQEADFCFQLKYNQNKNIYFTPFSKVLYYNELFINEEKNFTIETNTFAKKWKFQLDAIKATTIENRTYELYDCKSIVFFAGMVPEHDKDSGSNRLMEIIKAFLDLNYQVTLIVKNVFNDNKYIEFYQRLGVNVFYEHQQLTSTKNYLKSQKINANLAWFYGPKPFINYYKQAKKYLPNAKLVYDMVDIHHLRYKRASELDPKRYSLKKNFKLYKKLEIKAAAISDFVITISDFEQQYMKQFSTIEKLITISNIHYPKIDKSKTLPFKDRDGCLFIGSTHTPNIDALYYLYEKIMPSVWTELPDFKVYVIGNISDKIKDILHPNIVFTGYVPDVAKYFVSCKFMIAPLRYGAGVKGKIGQAFEYFLPLITSSIGAEGMYLENYENALIDDSPEGFAQNMIQLSNDETLWAKLQANSEKSLEPFSRKNLKHQLLQLK